MAKINQDPAQIFGREKGSWAEETITVRLPEILQRTIEENDFSHAVVNQLKSLIGEIPDGKIRQLQDKDAPDAGLWQGYIKPWVGKDWLNVPWLFAEHYFYRRVMEATDFFNTGQDPFLIQKELGFNQAGPMLERYAGLLEEWRESDQALGRRIKDGLLYSLWGNQADLSLWPVGSETAPDHSDLSALRDHLLDDHSQDIIRLLTNRRASQGQVGIILDNAGLELVNDLALVDMLLETDTVGEITLLVKAHPTFVSDVIEQDVRRTVSNLMSSTTQSVSQLGSRLDGYLEVERLKIEADFFWNSPLAMWEMPTRLRQSLGKYLLVISKGDANYRRILGDRKWDFTLAFSEVVDYFPAPIAALRSLKAELALGMSLDGIIEVHNQDSDWMTNGRWAVIQFSPRGKH
jgi:uncharacterized protein with ATP-grasp and redox domains